MLQKLISTKSAAPLRRTKPVESLAPERREIELALVLVESGADAQTLWVIAAITADAERFGGTVLQIAGPLLLIAFSGVVGCGHSPQREAFALDCVARHRAFVRVLHGGGSALVGTVGSEARRSYTVLPDDFGKCLQQLSALPPGSADEFGSR